MAKPPKLKLMVASTVINFEDQLTQICSILEGYGYEVWNSHIGTIPVHPGKSNLENCVAAVRDCDLFLGFIRPWYGTGKIGDRSITHEEFRKAIKLNKPRWFLVHRDVTFARQLLKPYMFSPDKSRTAFQLKKNPVLDDLRAIDLYNDAVQLDIPVEDRKGHWVQEFYRLPEVMKHIESQLKNLKTIRRICAEMKK
jgi:hypothetical protein